MGRTTLTSANTFQFLREIRGSQAKDIGPDSALKLRTLMAENGFAQILGRAVYAQPGIRKAGGAEFASWLWPVILSGWRFSGKFVQFSSGSHVRQGVDEGIGWS